MRGIQAHGRDCVGAEVGQGVVEIPVARHLRDAALLHEDRAFNQRMRHTF